MAQTDLLKITIDGPAGAGKSTVSLMVAQRLGLNYLDTGAMYRAIALAVLQTNADIHDAEALAELVKKSELQIRTEADGTNKVFLNGNDVSSAIRQQDVSDIVSDVANHKIVRDVLIEKQRQMAERGGAVLDGRDIGTVVLPNAKLKIFLTASLNERAKRRHADLQREGEYVSFEHLKDAIARRDEKDSKNNYGPMVPAEDAIIINTDDMTSEQVADNIVELAKSVCV
jgi:cytidylate kinase